MRVVVKIGSKVLTRPDGKIDGAVISSLTRDIAGLREQGYQFVVVTSGAVSIGRSSDLLRDFRVEKWPDLSYSKEVLKNQMRAGYGQPELMVYYKKAFGRHGIGCAQVLATANDFGSRKRYLSMRTVTENYILLDIVPIYNENDVLSAEELGPTFNDNDHLATMVGAMIDARKLVILSSVDGFYLRAQDGETGDVVPLIEDVVPYLQMIDDSTSEGRGGMLSKLLAANQARLLGMDVHIANGKRSGLLSALLKGERIGTTIPAAPIRPKAAKRWVATASVSEGRIVVSTTLADLIHKRRAASILFPGIERVEGDFSRDQIVGVFDDEGAFLGKGQTIYAASELREKIAEYETMVEGGLTQRELSQNTAIHYNYFVFAEPAPTDPTYRKSMSAPR